MSTEDNILGFMLFMSALLCLLCFRFPTPPTPPSSSWSIILPPSAYKTLTHCNSLTFLWHDLWPSSPRSTSCSCFYTKQEDRACIDWWSSWREGQLDRNMKDTVCWEALGNYVDRVETRDGFYLLEREERDGWGRPRGTGESFTVCLFDLWKACNCSPLTLHPNPWIDTIPAHPFLNLKFLSLWMLRSS